MFEIPIWVHSFLCKAKNFSANSQIWQIFFSFSLVKKEIIEIPVPKASNMERILICREFIIHFEYLINTNSGTFNFQPMVGWIEKD